jgi:hypothetical protein
VTALPTGQTVDLPQVSPVAQTGNGLAFGHLDRIDAAIVHDAAILAPALANGDWIPPSNFHWLTDSVTGSGDDEGHGASSKKALGTVDDADAHDHPDHFNLDPPGVKASENGGGNHATSNGEGKHGAPSIDGRGANDAGPSSIDINSNPGLHLGALKASENGAGDHSTSGQAGEHGASALHGASPHDVEPASIAQAVLGSGAVGLLGAADSFHFKDGPPTFEVAGVVDHAAPDHVTAGGHHDDAAGPHGPLAGQNLDLPIPAPPDDISIVADHGKSHLVTHAQHDLIV